MRKPNTRKAGVPTQPRPVDENGFELDEWGLPLVGPRRIRALKDMDRRDPREFPEDWTPAPPSKPIESKAATIAQATDPVKENSNG